MLPGTSTTPSASTRGDRPTPKVACQACRSHKAKCDGLLSNTCSRCLRSNIECVYLEHRRGRKVGSKSKTKLSARRRRPAERGGTDQLSFSPVPSRTSQLRPRSESVSSGVRSPMPTEDTTEVILVGPNTQGVPNGRRSEDEPSISGETQHGWTDPVSASIMPLGIAKELISFYYSHQNFLVCVCDPVLYDFTTLRSKSAFLFTSCLVCATKRHRQQYHEACLLLQKQQCYKHFELNTTDIETLLALTLMTHWKVQDDQRSLTLLSWAISMGLSLGLDETDSPELLVAGERAVRQARAGQRAWMISTYMTSLTQRIGLCPGTSSTIRRCESFHDHPLALAGDAYLAAWCQIRVIGNNAKTHIREGVTNGRPDHSVVLRLIDAEISRWLAHWTTELSGERFKLYRPMVKILGLHIQLELRSSVEIDDNPANVFVVSEQYWGALNCLEAVLEARGVLRFVRDMGCMITSYASAKLVEVVCKTSLLGSPAQLQAYKLVCDVARVYQTLSHSQIDLASVQARHLFDLARGLET
ncbi:hypothetical protein BCR39DRAFT_589964 [Naematelia encephala]|uniref:Zn(2)-C6 fungal-type domain-containing protein n=1 Tax=Naematelia encephala TaxID=71784 RepID=A0A1Y2ATB6_9TREE|nr:hypothetical protein BCR39DRAFT_589964 [Naematelia encephala]